jgi:hypothetical protein
MDQNNDSLLTEVEHPLVSIMTNIAYALCKPKNVYKIVTVHAKHGKESELVTWMIRRKGAQRLFVESYGFDAILKYDRPLRYHPELMRVAYDQVLQIFHSNKPLLEDGQMALGATLLYENEAAYHTLYA